MSELTEFPLTTAAQMTAADWTAKNPVLEQFQMGVESDTGKTKVCMGPRTAWNSLDYWSPSGSGVQIVPTTVQTNVGTKQALLAAVPTGKVRIITDYFYRNPSTDLSAWVADIEFTFVDSNSGVIRVDGDGALLAQFSAASSSALSLKVTGVKTVSGNAGEVFGVIFNQPDPAIPGTIDIDVHYYDVDA